MTRSSILHHLLLLPLLAFPQVGFGQDPTPTPVPAVLPPRPTQPSLLDDGAYGLPRVFAADRGDEGLTRYPWKMQIVSTIFWIGESATVKNPVANHKSSWDTKWEENFGGFDDPKNRNGFLPVGFVPKMNPFYIALPYNDLAGMRPKQTAETWIPWYKEEKKKPHESVLKGRWIVIRHDGKMCYAQWEDCGPFNTIDVSYVFGRTRPINYKNGGAGIDISPAIRDFLGLRSGERCDWRFVNEDEVPDGPWRNWTGEDEPAEKLDPELEKQRARLVELRKMRDEWMLQTGAEGFRKK